MAAVDLAVLGIYLLAMLGVGFYFHFKNSTVDDYYVGGRRMGKWHIGLSVVATDVGGGFSIGLGGLGFLMGLSGSWLLFTGLLGAWLSGIFLIPRIKPLSDKRGFFTFPEVLGHFFGSRAAFLAAIISGIGYLGFTGSQLLAGAKLASGVFAGLDLETALIILGLVAVVYTVMGGIKAVIYTDTIQWILLMAGLIFLALPLAYHAVGGWEVIRSELPESFFSFGELSWQQALNWLVTILPIWFIGMTLYQRIYASRSVSDARKAWFIAGLFEWPVMAMMGVGLGMLARVAFQLGMFEPLGFYYGADFDNEMGLPLLLRTVLPTGLIGLVLAAYFSAILSTADSCLMASSSNFLKDIIQSLTGIGNYHRNMMWWSKGLTLLLGVLAVWLAMSLTDVLALMLYSYAFMVSGLFVPLIAALFFKQRNENAAIVSMIMGGGTTLALLLLQIELPFSLDANVFGITMSLMTFILYTNLKFLRNDTF
jgi:solute:Na+ symporter, SSS family